MTVCYLYKLSKQINNTYIINKIIDRWRDNNFVDKKEHDKIEKAQKFIIYTILKHKNLL